MTTAQHSHQTQKKLLKIGVSGGIAVAIAIAVFLFYDPSALQAQVNNESPASQSAAVAQPPTNPSEVTLTAIPPRLGEDGTLKVKPGEKLQLQVRVRNTSDTALPILTSIQDFILAEDGETPIAVADNTVSNRWSVASWVTLAPTESTIQPRQTIGINLLIEVPEDALPGGKYAMVLHTPNAGGQGQGENSLVNSDSSSAISQKVGTLLYIIVDGPINEEAFVRDFSFPKFTEYGPVPFSFTAENNSDVHITPQTKIDIYNLFNQKVDTIQVESKNVFPLTSREFSGEWRNVWGYGPYTAELTMSFGSAGALVIATTSFWLLPIKLLIAAGVALLSILIIIWSIKRHLKHRQNQEELQIAELEQKIKNLETPKLHEGDTDDSR